MDISKEAVAIGAKRGVSAELAVASVYRLPLKNGFFDLLFSVFAPVCSEEFYRVLKPEGVVIRVLPLERHLWGLKKAIYDTPYENEPTDLNLKGFEITEKADYRDVISIGSNKDIMNLFKMTPYYYKSGVKDQLKLKGVQNLKTEIEFLIITYKRDNR